MTAANGNGSTSLEVDRAAIRAIGRLRLAAGIACALAGAWIALASPGRLGWTIAILGWLAGLGWTLAYRRSRKEAGRADLAPMLLDAERLRWSAGPHQHELAWREVAKVGIDEDRLEIQVCTHAGVQYRIQSIYRGVGAHDLAELLEQYRIGASQSAEWD